MQVPWCIILPVLIYDALQLVGWPGVGSSDLICGREDYTGLGRGCVFSGVWLGIPNLDGKLALKPFSYWKTKSYVWCAGISVACVRGQIIFFRPRDMWLSTWDLLPSLQEAQVAWRVVEANRQNHCKLLNEIKEELSVWVISSANGRVEKLKP